MESKNPTRKTVMAERLQRGDVLVHERRRYRVQTTCPTLQYRPRQTAECLLAVWAVPARRSGGRSIKLVLRPDEFVAVTR